MNDGSYYAIVLAAGRSTRMRQCKTELPWLNGTTLLSYQVGQLLLANIQPIVVLGPQNCDQCIPYLHVNQWVINPFPDSGKVSSILVGLQCLPKTFTGVVISAVDQPRPVRIYRSLIGIHSRFARPITVPTYRGKWGHPLLFSSCVMPLLQTLTEETLGLRRIVKRLSPYVQPVEFDTPTVLMDLNTPEEYQKGLLLALNEANRKLPSDTTDRKADPEHCQRF